MSKWQDISTAPKDGTTVLLREDDGFISTAMWDSLPDGFDEEEGWVTNLENQFGVWSPDYMPAFINPTHWMPLPDGPEGE